MNFIKYRLLEASPEDGAPAGGGEGEGGGSQGPSEETIKLARTRGWQPRERWRGPAEAWVDADEYVKRSETFIPFLRKQLAERDNQVTSLREELAQTRESINELINYNSEMARERAENRKTELGAQIRQAREAGDDVRVAELQNQLTDVTRAAEDAAKRAKTEPAAKTGRQPSESVEIQPWLKTWIGENQEFVGNPRKTALLNAIIQEKRAAGDQRVGVEFMDEARDEVEEVFDRKAGRTSRTEESRPAEGSGGRNSGRGQTFADLPAEARAQADKDEKRFVGKGRLFENQAKWREYFAREYFK